MTGGEPVRTLVILDKGLANHRLRPWREDMVQRSMNAREAAAVERLIAHPRFPSLMEAEIVRPTEEEDDVYRLIDARVKAWDRELDAIADADGVWLSDDVNIAPDYAPVSENGRTVLRVCLHLFCGETDVGPVHDIILDDVSVTVVSGPIRLTVARDVNSFRNGNSCCDNCKDSEDV